MLFISAGPGFAELAILAGIGLAVIAVVRLVLRQLRSR